MIRRGAKGFFFKSISIHVSLGCVGFSCKDGIKVIAVLPSSMNANSHVYIHSRYFSHQSVKKKNIVNKIVFTNAIQIFFIIENRIYYKRILMAYCSI